jgi:hypothetical protein
MLYKYIYIYIYNINLCRFEFHIYLYYINIFTHPILKYSSIQFWIKLTFLIANIALLSALRILVFNQSAQERKQLKEGERWRNMTLCVAVLSIYILFISLSLSLSLYFSLPFFFVSVMFGLLTKRCLYYIGFP